MLGPMAQRKNSRFTSTGWFSEFGKYIVLVVVAAITALLVVMALNQSAPTPTGTIRPLPSESLIPAPTPTATPTPTADAAPATVAFLGDSYTAGEGATAPGRRWTTLLSAANNWIEVNVGAVGTGYSTAGSGPGASAFTSRVAQIVASAPDIVVVSGGRFDYTSTASATEVSAAIAATFDLLRAGLPESQIVATSPIWDVEETPARLQEIASEVRAAVEGVGGLYLDVGQPLIRDEGLVAPGGIVPTDAGHAALFDVIQAGLTSALNVT